MTVGNVTYSGIQIAKGATYTQTRGVTPDVVSVRVIPQQAKIAEIGDVTLFFGFESIIIKDCLADKSSVWLGDRGFTGSFTFLDRRWRWSRYPQFSAHFNERDAGGDLVPQGKASLRDIFTAIFLHINENADVSRVSDAVFPEVDVLCVDADKLIETLAKNFGYEICLGFGDEQVTVWPHGTGDDLPGLLTSALMVASQGVDPVTPPQYSQVCFGPSMAQARFLLEAVGLDTDGVVKPIGELSYEPEVGWEKTYPVFFSKVLAEHGEVARTLARATVYRWYRIVAFSDGSLDFPDGTGALQDITQVLPLLAKLMETERKNDSEGKSHHPEPRVYGSYTDNVSFEKVKTFDIGDRVTRKFNLDLYRGIVKFTKPLIKINYAGEKIEPAELYLEAAFRIRDSFNRQFISYVNTLQVNASGQGYQTHLEQEKNARTIIEYDENHAAIDNSTNQVAIDDYANQIHLAVAGTYTTKAARMAWYNRPMTEIRLDGVTSQITHVITDGTDTNDGHMSIAAQDMEYDLFIRTAAERQHSNFVIDEVRRLNGKRVLNRRSEKGND